MRAAPKRTQIEELPEGWIEINLNAAVESMKNGLYKPATEYAEHGVACLRMYNIDGGMIIWKNIKRMLLTSDEVNEYQLAPDDLLVNRVNSRELVGKTAVFPKGLEPCVYESKNIRVRLVSELVNSDFVNYQLLLFGQHHFNYNSQQVVGMASISQPQIGDFPLSVPPRIEQDRIVSKVQAMLGKLAKSRSHIANVIKTLKRFRQAVLAAACSGRLTEDWREQHSNHESATELVSRVLAERVREYEDHRRHAQARGERPPKRPDNLQRTDFVLPEALTLHEIPEAWSWVSVRDVVLFAQYGTSVKADSTPDQGVPILRMGNIQDGQIDLTSLKYITRESEDISEFTIAKGDILFNRTNSPELVGKTAIYDSDLEAVFASYLIRLRCDQRVAHSGYLSSWINSPWGKWWARTVRTDGVSQSNINATILQTMPLPLPPLHEQEEIVQRINALLALSATIEESVSAAHKRTDKLTQSILAKAFRGELVPTEAELARREGRQYEPASVLLERIRKDCQDRETSKQSRKAKLIAI